MTARAGMDEATSLMGAGDWSDAAAKWLKLLTDEDGDEATRSRVLINLARCQLEIGDRGKVEDAEESLAEAQKTVEESPDLALKGSFWLQKARLLDYQGKLKNALAAYTKAYDLVRESGEDLTHISLTLASAERRRGELTRALRRLEDIDGSALPERLRADWLDELGATHLARGDTQRAVDALEQALDLDESDQSQFSAGRSHLLLAEAYLRSGLQHKAKQHIDQAVRIFNETHSAAGLSEAYALLGLWYEEGEDYSNAIHSYLKGFELDRSGDDLVGQARAKRCLGRTFRKKGDSARAQDYFDEARRLLPRDDDVEMGALLSEEGHLALGGAEPNYALAVNRFGEALRIAVEDGDLRSIAVAKRNLAKALRENSQHSEAEHLLREAWPALEERGDLRELDDLLADLGEVLLEQDRYPEAIDCFERSLKLDEQLGAIGSKGRSLLLLGTAYLNMGEREQAGAMFEEALSVYEGSENDVGKSEAFYKLGSWYAEEGRLTDAVRCFRKGVNIDKRLNDRIGVVRANCALGAVYRRRGDLKRAEELLDEAEQELRGINDPMERAHLLVERGRLALAEGSYKEARDCLSASREIFRASNSQVQVATCQRLLGNVAIEEGRYRQAESLLTESMSTFDKANDKPELDEVWDDMGCLYLLTGRFDDAERAVRESLEIGRRMGWRHGKGRSLLLLGQIAIRQRDMPQALKHIELAKAMYDEVDDEVGLSETWSLIGDWYASDANAERDLNRAASAYKEARRLDQSHRDQRGMARCNRKLGRVYRLEGQPYRAEEALEQAEDNLRGIDDPREIAPLEYEMGALHVTRGDHANAIPYLRRALTGFKSLELRDDVASTYQLLIAAYQALNRTNEALECIREMGLAHASMWNVLVKDLHPMISGPSAASFVSGNHEMAIIAAFKALEADVRSKARSLDPPLPTTEPISRVIKAWLSSGLPGVPEFPKDISRERFCDLCVSAFELIRNPANHGFGDELAPVDAFASLAVAHLIAKRIAG